jgi:hypothetical protein
MSIQPPDPNIIQANLNAQGATSPFTARESQYYNDPNTMQQEYGIADEGLYGAIGAMGGTQGPAPANPFSAIPIASSRAEFYEAIQIFGNESDTFMHAEDSQFYGQQGPSRGYWYNNNAASPSPWTGPNSTQGAPAPITEVPTSTTDPNRPRTVAAGYAPTTRTLTVVFRDGTFYNYYEVDGRTWQNFKRARSKGRFILVYLDSKPRGPADVSTLSGPARETLYRLSRTGQIKKQGVTGRQSATSKRGGRGTYKPGNLGGTGRKRAKGKP